MTLPKNGGSRDGFQPLDIYVRHRTSGALLYDEAGKSFFVAFPTTDAYRFSSVTGIGKESRSRMWVLPVEELRKLRDELDYCPPEQAPPKKRKPRKGKATHPRQTSFI